MRLFVFGIGLLTSIVLLSIYLISYVRPVYRLWPPGERNWKFWMHWTINITFYTSLFVLAYLDWNSFILPQPASLIMGTLLFFLGLLIAGLVEFELGSDETLGLEGELRTGGLYRY